MKHLGPIVLCLVLAAGAFTLAGASERLVLYEYFNNTS
jgi:hypothetical protein